MRELCKHGLTDRYKNGRCRACKLEQKRRARSRDGRKRSPAEKASEQRLRATVGGQVNFIIHQLRKRVKAKKFPAAEIDGAWLRSRLQTGTCELSGLPFKLGAGPRSPFSPSVDRIDSSKPYTKENCRVILWALNAAFAEWGEDTFRLIAKVWLAQRPGCDLI